MRVRCGWATAATTLPAMKTALAAALVLASLTAASASPTRDDRYFVAWASASDVTRAMRCPPPLGCQRAHRRHHRYRKAVAHKRSLVSRTAHARAPVRPPHDYRTSVALAGRPSGCPARAWCGCWLAHYLGMPARHLWLAANWRFVGRPAGGPAVGAIVVWRHHVGIITGRAGSRWVVKSGNDGRRVRERPRALAGAIAYRVRS